MGVKLAVKNYIKADLFGGKNVSAQQRKKAEEYLRYELSVKSRGRAARSRALTALVHLIESGDSKRKLDDTIKLYQPEWSEAGRFDIRRLRRDIYFSELYYGIDVSEYFRYRFYELSDACRKEHVGQKELTARISRLADPEERAMLIDKYRCFLFFRPYYKRDAAILNDEDDLVSFKEFCSKHRVFFTKPIDQSRGAGVRRLELGENDDIRDLFSSLTSEGTVIVEEPIRQGRELARFHPQSINTVRVVTARVDGKVEIVQSCLRMGRGASVIDNASSGGLSAPVDHNSGIITGTARYAYQPGRFERHPDTGEQIPGSRLPEWDSLTAMVLELADMLKKQRIVGWDMAYSVDGWLMVEANTNPGLQILAGDGVGVRGMFERITA